MKSATRTLKKNTVDNHSVARFLAMERNVLRFRDEIVSGEWFKVQEERGVDRQARPARTGRRPLRIDAIWSHYEEWCLHYKRRAVDWDRFTEIISPDTEITVVHGKRTTPPSHC